MRTATLPCLAVAALCLLPATARADNPEATVLSAAEILREQTTMTGARIPQSLLADAHGLVIVPNVIKIGFVAAVRRGHGVVLVRDPNGAWTLPQFVTLTGGSVGWQAGIQDTDVVLVFMTKKSVDNLLRGKFTIGADASAAAGPVGRNASAATDARLKAEILSYSRSRGLFAGVALDGSVIDVDPVDYQLYYGSPINQQPARVPESAMKLVQDIVTLTETSVPTPAAQAELAATPGAMPAQAAPQQAVPQQPMPGAPQAVPEPVVGSVRDQLAVQSRKLYGLLDDQWRQYLALPAEVYSGGHPPQIAALQQAMTRYDQIARSTSYEALVSRPEFQSTYALLRDYIAELSRASTAALSLPPPPTK